MKSVFEYLDYRVYLKDFYEDRKCHQYFFTYRFFGGKVGVDPSYLAKVLLKCRHIADESIGRIAAFCGLKNKEAEYFEAMVYFIKAKSHKQSKLNFEKMYAIRNVSARQLLADQYEYYRKWYYSAVRSVLEYHEFAGDYKALAAILNPAISIKEAKEAIALLTKLDLVRRNAGGRYHLTGASVTSGGKWQSLAIEAFQEETIRLSQEALQRHPKSDRDISTVTMNVNARDYADMRERIKEFRIALINQINSSTDPDRTYQLNITLFPLTRIGGAKP